MKLPCYSYVGLIKKNSKTLKVLVRSDVGRYYVWNVKPVVLKAFQRVGGGHISSSELELASLRQVDVGRGSLWRPAQSKITSSMVFHGIVSGGKIKKTVLVSYPDGCANLHYFTYAVPFNTVSGLSKGDFIDVDIRYMFTARQDQIEAGLGYGKLRRKKKLSV